jgi:hypothetical protein
LSGLAIQQEKGLAHFHGLFTSAGAVSAHLPLGIAVHAVRIQGQQLAAKMFSRPAQLAPKSSRKSCRGDGGRDFLHHFAGVQQGAGIICTQERLALRTGDLIGEEGPRVLLGNGKGRDLEPSEDLRKLTGG